MTRKRPLTAAPVPRFDEEKLDRTPAGPPPARGRRFVIFYHSQPFESEVARGGGKSPLDEPPYPGGFSKPMSPTMPAAMERRQPADIHSSRRST